MSGDFLARLARRALGSGDFVAPNSPPLFSGPSGAELTEVHEMAEVAGSPTRALPAQTGDPRPPETSSPRAEPRAVEPVRTERHAAGDQAGPSDVLPVTTQPAPPLAPRSVEPPPAVAEAQPRRAEPAPALAPTNQLVARPAAATAVLPQVRPAARVQPAFDAPARPGREPRPRLNTEPRPPVEAPIQVSIGEVVVRLVEERPVASLPRPAVPSPSLSLADYLRSRDRHGG